MTPIIAARLVVVGFDRGKLENAESGVGGGEPDAGVGLERAGEGVAFEDVGGAEGGRDDEWSAGGGVAPAGLDDDGGGVVCFWRRG